MTDTVQSIDRAVAMLTEVAARPDGLSGLARRTAMPTSTAARILGTLAHADALVRDPDGTYRIGPAIIGMARAAGPTFLPLELAARSHLQVLAEVTGEASGLSVPIGDEICCVAHVDAPKPVQAEDWTGRTWPLDQGGSGWVMLATFGPDELAAFLERNPGVDACRLREHLADVEAAGVGWSHGSYRDDLNSVAAPVLDHRGRAVAALYVAGPSYRFPGGAEQQCRVERLLIDHAETLSSTIGSAP